MSLHTSKLSPPSIKNLITSSAPKFQQTHSKNLLHQEHNSEMAEAEVVKNKQVLFKDYVVGFPKESDFIISTENTISLKVPENSSGVLVKNLYLSCDPFLRGLMRKPMTNTPTPFPPYKPGSVCDVCFLLYCLWLFSFFFGSN